MMNILKKVIISIDFIGFPVALNFDKKGNYYQTFFGGISTLALLTFSIFFSTNGLFKIINHGQDTNLQQADSLD